MKDWLIIIALITAIILGPLATIWSINTLFHVGIGYTFWTWLATFWIQFLLLGSIKKSHQSN